LLYLLRGLVVVLAPTSEAADCSHVAGMPIKKRKITPGSLPILATRCPWASRCQ
jgi:hypothetical protein